MISATAQPLATALARDHIIVTGRLPAVVACLHSRCEPEWGDHAPSGSPLLLADGPADEGRGRQAVPPSRPVLELGCGFQRLQNNRNPRSPSRRVDLHARQP